MRIVSSDMGKRFSWSKLKFFLLRKKNIYEEEFSELVDSLFPNNIMMNGFVYVLDGSYFCGGSVRIDYVSYDYPFNQPDIQEINILSVCDDNYEDCIKRFKKEFKKLKNYRVMSKEEKDEWIYKNSKIECK